MNIAINGAMGRMGQAIYEHAKEHDTLDVHTVLEHPGHPLIQKPYLNSDLTINTIKGSSLKDIDCIIDFSIPDSTIELLKYTVDNRISIVIGTTGFNADQTKKIEQAAEKIPILISANMSVGVNLLFSLVASAAKTLQNKNFDPEIVEIHHRNKKDAPSGTSRTLERILSKEYNLSETEIINGREGFIGERPSNQIGSMALRGGDVVGEHTVFFLGDGERIELKHSASSRSIFAKGSLVAAEFLSKKDSGLFTMADVLNL